MTVRYNTKGTGVWATQFPTRNSGDELNITDGGDVLDTIASDAAKDYLAVRWTAGTTQRMLESVGLICDYDQSSTGVLDFSSYGRLINHGGGSTGIGYRTICRPAGDGTLNLGFGAACTYARVEVERGKCNALALAVCTTLIMSLAGKADLAYHATPVTLAEVMGDSFVTCRRVITTARIGERGTLVMDDQTIAPATIEMRGGTFRPKGGTIGTAATLLGGVLDCRNLQRDLDISGATVKLGAGLTILEPAGASSNSSPRIIWPAASSTTFYGSAPKGYRA